jgi:S1-C subfamily serine protease
MLFCPASGGAVALDGEKFDSFVKIPGRQGSRGNCFRERFMNQPGLRLPSRAVAVLAATAALVVSPGLVARGEPLNATVFVRLVGHVKVLRGDSDRVLRQQLLDLREVEVGSGSGFIISPHGWVVTNNHVVSGEKFIVTVRGEKLEVTIDIARIEIALPGDALGQPARRYEASVYLADPELDLALLRVNATDLPYVGLGDSDVVAPGDRVNAIGYPLGRMLELETPGNVDVIPNPSVSAGAISAFRHDAAGERRHLQLSVALNPGNSGGPVVDSEGYAIGVAQSRVVNASAIGFAVPINRVKGMLQKYGLDSNLPVELLTPGTFIANPAKGVNIRVPAGFEDRSPLRVRVEATTNGLTSGSSDGASSTNDLALRIDRVATARTVEQLERALLIDGMFERFHATADPRHSASRSDNGRRVLTGHVSGTDATTGDRAKLVYAIVDLGREKIVARYAGPADAVAANRSLLQASLAELETAPLLTAEVTRIVRPEWLNATFLGRELNVPTVAGWVVEPGAPWQCAAGLLQPSSGLAMSPPGDFTVMLRAAWYVHPTPEAASAARRCSPQPGTYGDTSYFTQATAWGMPFRVEGVFIQRGDGGVWQLEMIAPLDKTRFVVDLFADWIRRIMP